MGLKSFDSFCLLRKKKKDAILDQIKQLVHFIHTYEYRGEHSPQDSPLSLASSPTFWSILNHSALVLAVVSLLVDCQEQFSP